MISHIFVSGYVNRLWNSFLLYVCNFMHIWMLV